MPIISYAQNFEDIMLWRALKHITKGFYIDVGAAWPTTDSVTKLFYENGWSGINIEPNPRLHQELEQERPRDINLNVAISNHCDNLEFYTADQAFSGLSTADKKVVDEHVLNGFAFNKVQVKSFTLAEIWKNFAVNKEVHFLKIDVEGLEQSVIESNDWTQNRPWVLMVEATVPLTQIPSYADWEHLLSKSNYQFVYQDGLNRFYVALEHSHLLHHFFSPPNVFDDFITYNHYLAIDELCISKTDLDETRKKLIESQRMLNAIGISRTWKLLSKLLKLEKNIYELKFKIVYFIRSDNAHKKAVFFRYFRPISQFVYAKSRAICAVFIKKDKLKKSSIIIEDEKLTSETIFWNKHSQSVKLIYDEIISMRDTVNKYENCN